MRQNIVEDPCTDCPADAHLPTGEWILMGYREMGPSVAVVGTRRIAVRFRCAVCRTKEIEVTMAEHQPMEATIEALKAIQYMTHSCTTDEVYGHIRYLHGGEI